VFNHPEEADTLVVPAERAVGGKTDNLVDNQGVLKPSRGGVRKSVKHNGNIGCEKQPQGSHIKVENQENVNPKYKDGNENKGNQEENVKRETEHITDSSGKVDEKILELLMAKTANDFLANHVQSLEDYLENFVHILKGEKYSNRTKKSKSKLEEQGTSCVLLKTEPNSRILRSTAKWSNHL